MLSSAIASSSPVVMPTRTEDRSSSSVSPTTRPARRIASICSGDLIWMPRSLRDMSALGHHVEGVEDARGDLVDLAHPVDLGQDAAVAVDADQRLGLLGVDLLAAPDDLLRVVRAALGLGPLEQALDQLLA